MVDDIIVFAGHFAYDPGCVVDGITEHTYTSTVADKIVNKAQDAYMPVLEGISSQLWHKIDWVNEKFPDSCGVVEVHFNCAESVNAQGTEVIYHEGSYYGKLLASCIYRHLIRTLWGHFPPKIKCRGVKTDKQIGRILGMLLHTKQPAVITESLFLSNNEERELIVNKKVQDKIAQAHVDGLKDYLLLCNSKLYY